MAYRQKSDDISGLMMKMKSPLNYGGESAIMKKEDPEKTSKDLKSTKILKAVGGEEAMAKAYTNESYKFVSNWAIRLHGGIGTSREHDISLYYLQAKANDIAYGGSNFHNEIVAQKIGLK